MTVNVSVSGGTSGSLPVSVTAFGVFSVVLMVCASATGVPTATVSDTAAGALVFVPLPAVKVKLSAPW